MNIFQYLSIGLVVAFAWWLTVRSVLRPGDEIKVVMVALAWPFALPGLLVIRVAILLSKNGFIPE